MNADYYLYDQVLLGQKKTCGKELFASSTNGKKENNPKDEETVLSLVRYFIEYYMEWSPEDAMESLTPELLKQFHLDTIIRQRLTYPVELDPLYDIDYLVARCYPRRFRYNGKKAVESYYQKVLDGTINRFQKGFFSQEGGQGEERAFICMRMMLSMIGPFKSVREIYDLFASSEGRQYLSEYKLACPCRDLFEFPIDFVHYALPENQRDELYYHMLRFKLINDKQKRLMKKKGALIA